MRAGLALILGLAALILIFAGTFVVDETEQVIITRLGKPVERPIVTPGLKLKVPFFDRVRRFDRRYLEWDGDRDEVPTKDKRFIWVDTYARWQITEPLRFFERLRDENGARRRLDDIIDGEARNALAKYDLAEVVRTTPARKAERDESQPDDSGYLEAIEVGREAIRQEILVNARGRTADLGIEILDVQFKRINYAEPDVRKSLEDRMIAERQRIAARYRSEGEGEALRILGEKDRELKRILSGAERQAEEIRGGADAEATDIYAQAYDRSAETRGFYAFLKSLETYQVIFDSETTVVLSTNSDLYRYLKDPG